MIKVHRTILMAINESQPAFLRGLAPESLLDLSWTDPALGVSSYGWWPVDTLPADINPDTEVLAGYTYTANPETWRVTATPIIEAQSAEYIAGLLLAKKAQRLAELAALRYEKETAGIALNGATIRTDRESQGLINGAWSGAQMNPAVLIDFKGANGWIQITATEINVIAMAVFGYVQACFTHERALSAAIEAAESVADVRAVDLTTGWPA